VSARVAGVDVDHAERTALANTGLVEIEGDPASGWRLVAWSPEPVGGPAVDALVADDPTGEPVED
jgi:probable phosphoglycerate mutase